MPSLIESVLPPDVLAHEVVHWNFGRDVKPETELHPDEWQAVQRAVPKRLRDFCGGRHCARHTLRTWGWHDVPILKGQHGEPLWPHGVIGSITHCESYCAAATTTSSQYRSLGIDAEPDAPLPESVWERVVTDSEAAQLERLPAGHWGRLLFSAKESIFKAWFPLTHQWIDFADVDVRFELLEETFSARAVGKAALSSRFDWRRLAGRFRAVQGLLITSAVMQS
jgi:4'-phosphopantetheinyl transferase EntD